LASGTPCYLVDRGRVRGLRTLLECQEGVRVVAEAGDGLEALRSGVTGYILKSISLIELMQAVHSAAAGRRYLSPPCQNVPLQPTRRRRNHPAGPIRDVDHARA
jgi:DNA-binding NarL/FixJ family response regulator